MLKTRELRELTAEEANNRLRDAKEELENLRFQHSLRQLENEQRLKSVRKEIAQLKTIVHEDELGLRKFPGTEKEDIKENKE